MQNGWERVLKITSLGPEADIDRDVKPSGIAASLPSIGSLPNPSVPTNTRFAFIKRAILRVLRVYSRGQQEVINWLYLKMDEQRKLIANRLATLSSELQELRMAQDVIRDEMVRLNRDSSEEIKAFVSIYESKFREVMSKKGNEEILAYTVEQLTHRMAMMEGKIAELDETTDQNELASSFAAGMEETLKHDGILGRHHLWFNPPIVLEFHQGIPRVATINERIIEPLEAVSSLQRYCPVGAKVLDIGSSESVLPYQMAVMGYQTTAVDVRPYPLRHPNLITATGDFFQLNFAPGSFHFITCVSSLEHFGLGWYDDPIIAQDGDVMALEKISNLLADDGLLLITTPLGGQYKENALERTYTRDILIERLSRAHFVVKNFKIYVHHDPSTWTVSSSVDEVTHKSGVAIVLAVKEDKSASSI